MQPPQPPTVGACPRGAGGEPEARPSLPSPPPGPLGTSGAHAKRGCSHAGGSPSRAASELAPVAARLTVGLRRGPEEPEARGGCRQGRPRVREARPTGLRRAPEVLAEAKVGGPKPEPALPEGVVGAPQGAEMARVAGLLEAALPARGTPYAFAVVASGDGPVAGQESRAGFRRRIGGLRPAVGQVVAPQQRDRQAWDR